MTRREPTRSSLAITIVAESTVKARQASIGMVVGGVVMAVLRPGGRCDTPHPVAVGFAGRLTRLGRG